MKSKLFLAAAMVAAFALPAAAAEVSVKVYKVDDKGTGEMIGKVYFADSDKGLVIKPRLKGLSPGDHGFHVHANRSFKPAKSPEGKMVPGLGAGGHYDPDKSGKHEGPTGKGHLGDLPALKVGADGTVKGTLMAPRLKVADLKKHSLMIHAGGDNYSDQPAALGGGGARVACGAF